MVLVGMEEADRVAALHEAFLDVADFQTIQRRHKLLIFLLQKKEENKLSTKASSTGLYPV